MKNNIIFTVHIPYVLFILSIILFFSYYTRIIPDGKLHAVEPPRGPDVFGSVGVPVSRSPYTPKWNHAAQMGRGAAWAKLVSAVRSKPNIRDKLEAVQYSVNRAAIWGADRDIWKTEDYWASPSELLRVKSGDCEDFAILKMMVLQAAGVNPNNTYLTVGYDTVVKQDHAILVVRDNGILWVLDERTDAVVRDDYFHYFNPVLSMNASHNWVHGYRIAGVWFAPTDRKSLLGSLFL